MTNLTHKIREISFDRYTVKYNPLWAKYFRTMEREIRHKSGGYTYILIRQEIHDKLKIYY